MLVRAWVCIMHQYIQKNHLGSICVVLCTAPQEPARESGAPCSRCRLACYAIWPGQLDRNLLERKRRRRRRRRRTPPPRPPPPRRRSRPQPLMASSGARPTDCDPNIRLCDFLVVCQYPRCSLVSRFFGGDGRGGKERSVRRLEV